jgi:hypothetical protein
MRNLLVAAVVIGVGGYFGAKFYVQYKAAKDLDQVLVQARPFVDIEYQSVVATLGGELRVEGVTIQLPQFDDAINIESLSVHTPSFLFLVGFGGGAEDFEFPDRLGIEVTGLRGSVDADYMSMLKDARRLSVADIELTAADHCASTYGFTPEALKRLGYYEVDVDFNADFRRSGGDELTFDIGTHVEDMYEFDLTATFSGLADPTALARGARPLLVDARLDYIDRSLNSRIFKHCAEQQVTAEDVVAALLREIQAVARESGMELDAMITQPYTDFLLGKQRFTITSEPVRPVDLTRISLYKPSDVPNLLNLTAEAG